MNDDNDSSAVTFFVGIFVGIVVGAIAVSGITNAVWYKESVERGVAHYDIMTGKWEWNTTELNEHYWVVSNLVWNADLDVGAYAITNKFGLVTKRISVAANRDGSLTIRPR